MCERLRDELARRKVLVAKLDELRKAKAAAKAEVDRRRKTLEGLQTQLQNLEETSRPLQIILAPQLSLRGFARTADLLPLPLYIIYSQLAAVREALGVAIRVQIMGSSVEAESFAKSQAHDPMDTGAEGAPAAGPGPSSEAAAAAAGAAAASGAAAGQPVAAAAGGGGGGPSVSGDELYKVHPLSVLLEVQREKDGRLQVRSKCHQGSTPGCKHGLQPEGPEGSCRCVPAVASSGWLRRELARTPSPGSAPPVRMRTAQART
jgi:THO complex subunit 5